MIIVIITRHAWENLSLFHEHDDPMKWERPPRFWPFVTGWFPRKKNQYYGFPFVFDVSRFLEKKWSNYRSLGML